MNYVLISDISFRKTFDIISILKKIKFKYQLLLGTESTSVLNSLKFKMVYGNEKRVLLRTQINDLFWEDLNNISIKFSGNNIVYLPVEENTTLLFLQYINKFGVKNFKYLLPSIDQFLLFRDKSRLNDYCLSNGFSAPAKYSIPDFSIADYPILLKPCVGSGSKGIFRLYSPDDYTDQIRIQIQKESYLAQELLPNGKNVHGAFFLCNEGKIIGAYTHKRIRTVPDEGGVSVFSKLTYNTLLIEKASSFLNFSKWTGLIMLEYLYDSKVNEYKLIEANPRLWGTIMLSEKGGAHLLENYIRLSLGIPCIDVNLDLNCYIRWPFMDFLGYLKKHGKIPNFWTFKNTCFINWSYAKWYNAVCFFLFSIFKTSNLKKFFSRI